MNSADACPITGLTKIILATDGSEHSEKAMVEALGLAKTCGTMLSVVTVVEMNSEYAALAPKAVEKAEVEAKQILDAAKARAVEESIQCEVVAVHGEDVAEVLVAEAEKLGADMIVMGRHGKRKGLKKLLMGSTVSKLISHAPCKVLVVP
jgi:nucleotide-binding universal stress UspA family protein